MTADRFARLTTLLERSYGTSVAALHPIVEYGEAEGGVYRVDRRNAPPWVVRIFARGRPLERVQGDAAVLAYIERYGVPAERLISAHDGSGSTELDGQGVVVTRHVAGARPDRSPTTLRRLGEAVGRLHALPPAPIGDPWIGRRAGAIPAEDLPFGRSWLARVAERVPPDKLAVYESLKAALDATDDCASCPSSLIHDDCHLDNAILASDGQPVLIDWVGAGQGPRIAALGVLLFSCAIRAPGDDPGSPWAAYWREHGSPPSSASGPIHLSETTRIRAAVEAVIEGYCRYQDVTSLELERLPDAVRFRPLVIAAREFATSLEQGTSPHSFGWWTRYAEAETVATYAREAVERVR